MAQPQRQMAQPQRQMAQPQRQMAQPQRHVTQVPYQEGAAFSAALDFNFSSVFDDMF
jgi:hypothetical protein